MPPRALRVRAPLLGDGTLPGLPADSDFILSSVYTLLFLFCTGLKAKEYLINNLSYQCFITKSIYKHCGGDVLSCGDAAVPAGRGTVPLAFGCQRGASAMDWWLYSHE